MKESNEYHLVGVMSGTSLDGLDIALCRFTLKEGWTFDLIDHTTVPYSDDWKSRLSGAHELQAEALTQLDHDLGKFIGTKVKEFLGPDHPEPIAIASHGHTVFHRPDLGYTLQIGSGADISSTTGIRCMNDFRSVDVSLGGQGAPLVPIGDRLLFSDFDACVNLGGIANISFEKGNKRIAFDICPVNMALNHVARSMGLTYDKNGERSESGDIDRELLEELNSLEFYRQEPPKSLGREWFEQHFLPLISRSDCSDNDLLRTIVEHIAIRIAEFLPRQGRCLFTGGGAFNSFLMSRIKANSSAEVHVPEDSIVDQKEAIIFAFLGVLRLRNETNTLASVTGASRDSVGGTIWSSDPQ